MADPVVPSSDEREFKFSDIVESIRAYEEDLNKKLDDRNEKKKAEAAAARAEQTGETTPPEPKYEEREVIFANLDADEVSSFANNEPKRNELATIFNQMYQFELEKQKEKLTEDLDLKSQLDQFQKDDAVRLHKLRNFTQLTASFDAIFSYFLFFALYEAMQTPGALFILPAPWITVWLAAVIAFSLVVSLYNMRSDLSLLDRDGATNEVLLAKYKFAAYTKTRKFWSTLLLNIPFAGSSVSLALPNFTISFHLSLAVAALTGLAAGSTAGALAGLISFIAVGAIAVMFGVAYYVLWNAVDVSEVGQKLGGDFWDMCVRMYDRGVANSLWPNWLGKDFNPVAIGYIIVYTFYLLCNVAVRATSAYSLIDFQLALFNFPTAIVGILADISAGLTVESAFLARFSRFFKEFMFIYEQADHHASYTGFVNQFKSFVAAELDKTSYHRLMVEEIPRVITFGVLLYAGLFLAGVSNPLVIAGVTSFIYGAIETVMHGQINQMKKFSHLQKIAEKHAKEAFVQEKAKELLLAHNQIAEESVDEFKASVHNLQVLYHHHKGKLSVNQRGEIKTVLLNNIKNILRNEAVNVEAAKKKFSLVSYYLENYSDEIDGDSDTKSEMVAYVKHQYERLLEVVSSPATKKEQKAQAIKQLKNLIELYLKGTYNAVDGVQTADDSIPKTLVHDAYAVVYNSFLDDVYRIVMCFAVAHRGKLNPENWARWIGEIKIKGEIKEDDEESGITTRQKTLGDWFNEHENLFGLTATAYIRQMGSRFPLSAILIYNFNKDRTLMSFTLNSIVSWVLSFTMNINETQYFIPQLEGAEENRTKRWNTATNMEEGYYDRLTSLEAFYYAQQQPAGAQSLTAGIDSSASVGGVSMPGASGGYTPPSEYGNTLAGGGLYHANGNGHAANDDIEMGESKGCCPTWLCGSSSQ